MPPISLNSMKYLLNYNNQLKTHYLGITLNISTNLEKRNKLVNKGGADFLKFYNFWYICLQ